MVAIIAGLAVPTGAVASGWLANTGWFGDPNPPGVGSGGTDHPGTASTESDSSEWLSVTAPDFVQVAAGLLPDYIVLPDGFDRHLFALAIARDIRDGIVSGPDSQTVAGSGALVQVTGVVGTYELHAQCTWRREWLDAFDSGDSESAAEAADVLTAAATWPATVATDGGGIVEMQQRIARAAAAGDRAIVASIGMQNCPPLPDGAGR